MATSGAPRTYEVTMISPGFKATFRVPAANPGAATLKAIRDANVLHGERLARDVRITAKETK